MDQQTTNTRPGAEPRLLQQFWVSTAVTSYLPVQPSAQMCGILLSLFLPCYWLAFKSFLGLVNASSVGQEKHCSSLNLHYLSTVGQDLVFLQRKFRIESSSIALLSVKWVVGGALLQT